MKVSNHKRFVPVQKRSGFTLMEILIVLAILAVIIGLVLPNFLGAQDRANKDAAKVAVDGVEECVALRFVHGSHSRHSDVADGALQPQRTIEPHFVQLFFRREGVAMIGPSFQMREHLAMDFPLYFSRE